MNNLTKNFLSVLFHSYFEKYSGYLEFRLIKKGCPPAQKFLSSLESCNDELSSWLEKSNSEGWNIHVGVLPRTKESGKAEDIDYVTTLWVDLDAKNFDDDKERMLETLLAFPVTPTMIVDSGHGYHAYWALEEPIDLREGDSRIHFDAVMRGLIKALNSDPAVKDPSRVMRLPGSKNCKDLNAIVNCELLQDYFQPELKYTLGSFSVYELHEAVKEKGAKAHLSLSPIAVPERFKDLLSQNARLRATWEGKASMPQDNSRSGFDMSLASQLVARGFVPDEIAAIMRQFPFGKGSEATDAYLEYTIAKAMHATSSL
jgi:RepB DNA-primase from phage plasmid